MQYDLQPGFAQHGTQGGWELKEGQYKGGIYGRFYPQAQTTHAVCINESRIDALESRAATGGRGRIYPFKRRCHDVHIGDLLFIDLAKTPDWAPRSPQMSDVEVMCALNGCDPDELRLKFHGVAYPGFEQDPSLDRRSFAAITSGVTTIVNSGPLDLVAGQPVIFKLPEKWAPDPSAPEMYYPKYVDFNHDPMRFVPETYTLNTTDPWVTFNQINELVLSNEIKAPGDTIAAARLQWNGGVKHHFKLFAQDHSVTGTGETDPLELYFLLKWLGRSNADLRPNLLDIDENLGLHLKEPGDAYSGKGLTRVTQAQRLQDFLNGDIVDAGIMLYDLYKQYLNLRFIGTTMGSGKYVKGAQVNVLLTKTCV